MSGHSKWATIKHKKGAADKARGKLFNKLARQIEVAAKTGGDIDTNPTLRTAVQKAKAGRMTNDAIDRAIKRGTGDADGGTYESIMYEGYAPGGVALMIDVLTDNRNRTGSEIRHVFSKLGGSMAEPGAVGWQFGRRGVILTGEGVDEDEVMLVAIEAGADDVIQDGDSFRIMTAPSVVYDVKAVLDEAGIEVISADSPMVSENLVPITDLNDAKAVLRILEALEDNDDVQDVFSNFDITDELMESGGVVSISVGDAAPDFTLPATGDRNVSLSDYAGQPVVLVFYPGDDTPVCTKQLNSYNDELEKFTELNAQVLGISAQDVSSHTAFSGKHGFEFPLAGRHRQDRGRACTARSGRSGSPAAACSSSTPAAWSATPTGRSRD